LKRIANIGVEGLVELSEARSQLENLGPELTKLDECFAALAYESIHVSGQIREPGPLLLLGAPGVGKGTQADKLAELWGVPKVSTGEILRANVANGTPLGVEANRIMKLGGLVPDQIMTEMVADRLGLSDTAMGFILDGFPRTVHQAQWLDGHLSFHPNSARLGIINLFMDLERIVDRIVHRRVCPLCKTIYNTQLMPPKRMGSCDKDNAELVQRSDDRLEVYQRRLDVFKRATEPLIQYYRGRSQFIEVDAEKPPSLVTRDIVAGLMNLRMQMDRSHFRRGRTAVQHLTRSRKSGVGSGGEPF
jgi:adenylate kinase